VSESVVENDVQKALRLIQSALHEGELLVEGMPLARGNDRDELGTGHAKSRQRLNPAACGLRGSMPRPRSKMHLSTPG
jgi:hypothetical protein